MSGVCLFCVVFYTAKLQLIVWLAYSKPKGRAVCSDCFNHVVMQLFYKYLLLCTLPCLKLHFVSMKI